MLGAGHLCGLRLLGPGTEPIHRLRLSRRWPAGHDLSDPAGRTRADSCFGFGGQRGRGFRSAGRLLPSHEQPGTRFAPTTTQRVAEEGIDGGRRDGRQDGLVRVPHAHRPRRSTETGPNGRKGGTVRARSGKTEPDPADPEDVRRRRTHRRRSCPQRTCLCRSHRGSRCKTRPARDPGHHQTWYLQRDVLLRGPSSRSRSQADEDRARSQCSARSHWPNARGRRKKRKCR